MILVARADGWTAAVQTLSGRGKVGRGPDAAAPCAWNGAQLRAARPDALPEEPIARRLSERLRAEATYAEARTAEEARDLLLTARERIRPLSGQGEVLVLRDAARRPPAFVVELYDPALGAFQLQRGALERWRADAASAFGPGWAEGPRPRACRRSGRAGLAIEVVCEAEPPWPDGAPAEPTPPPDWAFAALGLARGAGEDEVHAAYLAHLKLNHPDRVAHLSGALQKAAHEETLRIMAAHEALRRRS